jgi:hypothetical protein
MTAKRQPTPIAREPSLMKAEACRILQVAPAADEELITKAYWHLARKHRAYAPTDPEARERLDELNRAYVTLHPAETEAPLEREVPPIEEQVSTGFFEQVYVWWRTLVEHTKAVWPEHVGEVTALSVTTAVLTYLALSSGANAMGTLIVAGVAGLAIWAPWRRAG